MQTTTLMYRKFVRFLIDLKQTIYIFYEFDLKWFFKNNSYLIFINFFLANLLFHSISFFVFIRTKDYKFSKDFSIIFKFIFYKFTLKDWSEYHHWTINIKNFIDYEIIEKIQWFFYFISFINVLFKNPEYKNIIKKAFEKDKITVDLFFKIILSNNYYYFPISLLSNNIRDEETYDEFIQNDIMSYLKDFSKLDNFVNKKISLIIFRELESNKLISYKSRRIISKIKTKNKIEYSNQLEIYFDKNYDIEKEKISEFKEIKSFIKENKEFLFYVSNLSDVNIFHPTSSYKNPLLNSFLYWWINKYLYKRNIIGDDLTYLKTEFILNNLFENDLKKVYKTLFKSNWNIIITRYLTSFLDVLLSIKINQYFLENKSSFKLKPTSFLSISFKSFSKKYIKILERLEKQLEFDYNNTDFYHLKHKFIKDQIQSFWIWKNQKNDYFYLSKINIQGLKKINREIEILLSQNRKLKNDKFVKSNKIIKNELLADIENKYNEFEIKQIISHNSLIDEGDELHHCVWGYWYEVDKGDSFIFSIRNKNNNKIRSTIEIQKEKDYYILIQNYSYLNEKPDKILQNIWYELVENLNKKKRE